MKKLIRRIIIIFACIITIFLIGFGTYWGIGLFATKSRPLSIEQRNAKYQFSNTPTIFFHGWGGNALTFNKTINTVQDKNIGEKSLTVYVDFNNHLHFKGRWDNRAVNPMIQVIFYKNFPEQYIDQTPIIHNILTKLKRHYNIKNYNVVAHSWGGSAAFANLLIKRDANQPNLNKMILLGSTIAFRNPEVIQEVFHQPHQASPVPIKIYSIVGADQAKHSDQPDMRKRTQRTMVELKEQFPNYSYQSFVLPGVSHTELHTKPDIIQHIIDILWK